MKRKMIYLLLGFVAAVSISGCGQKEEETEFSTSAPEETAEEDMALTRKTKRRLPWSPLRLPIIWYRIRPTTLCLEIMRELP